MAPPVPTNPQETLRRAQRVELVAARAVNDAMVGAYLSRFKGRGTDFEELREYVPGDDVRTMDWNVTARTGKPFVRLHREERELTMVLAVDVSGSADFGSGEQTLRERAADVAGGRPARPGVKESKFRAPEQHGRESTAEGVEEEAASELLADPALRAELELGEGPVIGFIGRT